MRCAAVVCDCLCSLESERLDEWQAELWVRMYLPARHLVMLFRMAQHAGGYKDAEGIGRGHADFAV